MTSSHVFKKKKKKTWRRIEQTYFLKSWKTYRDNESLFLISFVSLSLRQVGAPVNQSKRDM